MESELGTIGLIAEFNGKVREISLTSEQRELLRMFVFSLVPGVIRLSPIELPLEILNTDSDIATASKRR